jgi:hypothetical protein
VAIGALLGLVLIGTLILAGLSGRPPAVLGPTSPPRTQSPSPSPSPSESPKLTQGPLSVQGALDQLALLLDQGVATGDISPRAANEVAKEIRDAIRKYEDGDLEGALDKLRDLQGKVEEREQKGEIEPDMAERLRQAISNVAAAMEANPPSPRSDGEGDGDGDD